jgi:large conductance mechanosensitive channel
VADFLKEFKKFISRGNVMDLAVGLVIGMAFQKIVSSLVGDIALPAISPLLNNINFASWHIGLLMLGNFVTALIDFIVIAFFIFLVVKFVNRFKKDEEVSKAEVISREERIEKLLIEIRDLLKK